MLSTTTSPILTKQFPSAEQIRLGIARDGYCVYHDAVGADCIRELRDFWCHRFRWTKGDNKVVRGDLLLGEKNILTYTDSDYWCLFREFSFLWNAPTHELTNQVGIEIHKIRNLAQGFPEDYGLKYSPDRYGIYFSTSWYEPNKGHLVSHTDGHKDVPILQYMLPITHKGIDFDDGGLTLRVGDGPEIDVDAIMKPGSIVFFDARNHHGVRRIGCSDPAMIGRIATFAIPTFFRGQDEMPEIFRSILKGYRWVERKINRVKGGSY